MNKFGGGTERAIGAVDETQYGEGCVRQRGKRLGKPGASGMMTILVPPAILDEMQAVFDLPMPTDIRLKLGCRYQIWIQAGREIPAFEGKKLAIGGAHLAVDANGDLAVREIQTFTNVRGIVQVGPKPTRFIITPLFSVTSSEGCPRDSSEKHAFKASNTSP